MVSLVTGPRCQCVKYYWICKMCSFLDSDSSKSFLYSRLTVMITCLNGFQGDWFELKKMMTWVMVIYQFSLVSINPAGSVRKHRTENGQLFFFSVPTIHCGLIIYWFKETNLGWRPRSYFQESGKGHIGLTVVLSFRWMQSLMLWKPLFGTPTCHVSTV